MPDFSFTGIYTEYDGKEGVLMKSRHIFADEEHNAQSSCNCYRNNDNFYNKSKLTAQYR